MSEAHTMSLRHMGDARWEASLDAPDYTYAYVARAPDPLTAVRRVSDLMPRTCLVKRGEVAALHHLLPWVAHERDDSAEAMRQAAWLALLTDARVIAGRTVKRGGQGETHVHDGRIEAVRLWNGLLMNVVLSGQAYHLGIFEALTVIPRTEGTP